MATLPEYLHTFRALPPEQKDAERKQYEDFLLFQEGCHEYWLRRGSDGKYVEQGVRAGWKAWRARTAVTLTGAWESLPRGLDIDAMIEFTRAKKSPSQ